MRTRTLLFLLLLLPLGCGGGGGGGDDVGVVNPGTALRGIWTGTFSDEYGDYTVSVEIGAPGQIPTGQPGRASVRWGAESVGFDIDGGDFEETGPGRWVFSYVTSLDGEPIDTVEGEFELIQDGALEGTFENSVYSGEFSLLRTGGFFQDEIAGRYVMEYTDADTREFIYVGEVAFDAMGNLVSGSGSFLSDDLDGDPEPRFPIVDGFVELVDAEVGYYEGELYFADPNDTVFLWGFLGADFNVFAGEFEDVYATGIFTFYPQD